jgi:hypothetical protein
MSFINWGHETPEQKEIRRRMEERMIFEQMSYNAAMAAASAGSGKRKNNYAISGRSSMASYTDEAGNYVYRTYNYDSDTLNAVQSTNLSDADYSDRIYVLQDRGFMMRYNGPDQTVYYFTDINGETIKKLTIDENAVDSWGVDYNDGVSIMVYSILGNIVTFHLFDGESVKTYTINDMYMYNPGNGDWYTRSIKNGVTLISWRTSDSSEYKLALMTDGKVILIDSLVAGASTWQFDSSWDSDFVTILKADYNTGEYQSFRVVDYTGTTLNTQNISTYGHNNLRDNGFYGKGKYFFILRGNVNADLDILSYDYSTNTVIRQTVANGSELGCTTVYHYQRATYPNGMSNWDDDGIIGINISNDLLVLLYNDVDYYEDGHRTQWYKVDECHAHVLFHGDTQFYSYDLFGAGLTAVKLDDNESLIRSFSEDQSIVLDAFTWNEGTGSDQSGEYLKRLSIKRLGVDTISYHVVNGTLTVGGSKYHDKFFLGSRLVYAYYDSDENHLQWVACDSDAQSNPTEFVLTVADSTEYYRTHDTLVIIDNGGEITYMSNLANGHTFTNMNIATEVWYNKAFISDLNGNGDISPTIEYAFYPNNTGWGTIVLVHDTGIDDTDYGKTISINRDDYSQFTLPMVYGNSWYGELGHNTLLFAWEDNSNGWTASLFDLTGQVLSSSKIAVDASLFNWISLWNINDRAFVEIDPDYTVGDAFFYYFGNGQINAINTGNNDYWWENDFAAWYNG